MSNGTCTDNTITVTTPSGVKKTRSANGSSCALNPAMKNDCAHAYMLYASWGYTGGRDLSWKDLLEWATASDAGWTAFCGAFLTGTASKGDNDCAINPFDGHEEKGPTLGQVLNLVGVVGAGITCYVGSALSCFIAANASTALTAGGEFVDHVPPGQIAKDAAVNTVVNVFASAIGGAVEYAASDAEKKAAQGTAFADLEVFQFSGTQLRAVRGAAALPGETWNQINYYQAFTANGGPVGAGVTDVTPSQ